MDKNKIIDELLSRNIIADGTNVYAEVNARGLGGTPVRVKKTVLIANFGKTKGIGWERDDAGKDWTFPVHYKDIEAIEGMDIKRFAQAYKIKIK